MIFFQLKKVFLKFYGKINFAFPELRTHYSHIKFRETYFL